VTSILARAAAVLAAGGVLALSGCESALPERFYTLSAQGSQPRDGTQFASQSPPGQDLSVAVAAVTIPGTLDRPQMVQFVGDGRIDLTEQERWGEPLAHGIARTLAEDLRDRLGVPMVAAYPQDASAHARFKITVDFSHLDARSGDVLLDAIWTVRDTQGAQPGVIPGTQSGHTVLTQPALGSDGESSVLAQSAALAHLSDALAAAVKMLEQPH
jgi:uncharacterized lipoprotein YmbA